jgi:hypothetical protein
MQMQMSIWQMLELAKTWHQSTIIYATAFWASLLATSSHYYLCLIIVSKATQVDPLGGYQPCSQLLDISNSG